MVTEGMLFTLVLGAYAYTHQNNKGVAKKEDLERVERKVEMMYEHLLNKPMPEMPKANKAK
jgi:hypothetical protein